MFLLYVHSPPLSKQPHGEGSAFCLSNWEERKQRLEMMFQRAAGYVYSSQWASHERTNQSKWLEQSLKDTERKFQHALKLLHDDGESFAKRAEMYYKTRPELINLIEDIYKAYRALAKRYDHISTELQNANATVGSLFPAKVTKFSMDKDETDREEGRTSGYGKKPTELYNMTDMSNSHRLLSSENLQGINYMIQHQKLDASTSADKYGLNRAEAVNEITQPQKNILALRTGKKFFRSSYAKGIAKYREIEKQENEKQERVDKLKGEFETGMVTEDIEAQKLMAKKAIDACDEKLEELEMRQERAIEEAKAEERRIEHTKESLKLLLNIETQKTENMTERSIKQGIDNKTQKRETLGSFQSGMGSLTFVKLAEKIDVVVNKVINLETTMSSQSAFIRRLGADIDNLQARVCYSDENVTPIGGRKERVSDIRELKLKLEAIQDLYGKVEENCEMLINHLEDSRVHVVLISGNHKDLKPDEVVGTNLCTDVNVREESYEERNSFKKEKGDHDDGFGICSKPNKQSIDQRRRFKYQDGKPDRGVDDSYDGDQKKKKDTNAIRDRGSDQSQEQDKKDRRDNLEDHRYKKTSANSTKDVSKFSPSNYAKVLYQLNEAGKKTSAPETENGMEYEVTRSANRKLHAPPNGSLRNIETEGIGGSDIQKEKHETFPDSVDLFRTRIDAMQEETLSFWLRFSAPIYKVQKFDGEINNLKEEILKIEEKGNNKGSVILSICKRLKEMNTQLRIWLEESTVLQGEIASRSFSLIKLESEATKALEDSKFTSSETAVFRGEVANMKQQSVKMLTELQTGSDHTAEFQIEVENMIAKLNEGFAISCSTASMSQLRRSVRRSRIPLSAFLFGNKPKTPKRSLFRCMQSSMYQKFIRLP